MSAADPKPESPDLLAIAYHEAGHAVVDYDHERLAGSTTIVPDYDRGTAGASHGENWVSQLGPDPTEEEVRSAIEVDIVSLYAGLEAQRLVDPDADPAGAGQDLEEVRELADLEGLDEDDLEGLRQRAADHVAHRRDAIDRLARTLLVLHTLQETQTMAAIEEEPVHTEETSGRRVYIGHMSEDAQQRYREWVSRMTRTRPTPGPRPDDADLSRLT